MSTPVKLGWRGGVNLLSNPASIRDDQLAVAKNCWPLRDGELAKREPLMAERNMIVNGNEFFPLAMFIPDPITGFAFILHYTNAAKDEFLVAGTFDDQDDATLVRVAIGNRQKQPVSFTNYKGAVIAVVPGVEGFYSLVQNGARVWGWVKCYFNYDDYFRDIGSPIASIQPQATSVFPRVSCVYRGRMCYFNFGPGMGNWMVMADRSDYKLATSLLDRQIQLPLASQIGPDVLASNGRHFEFASLQGQDILAAEEISINAVNSALETALLIKTDKHATICTGELSETTDDGTTYSSYLGNFVANKVNFNCGIAGAYATCRAPNGTFWANQEDVYVMYDGEPRPIAIGTNIRPALQAGPQELRKLWWMAYANGAVYLAIPTSGSTDEAQMVVEHWRLDLRPRGEGDTITRPQGPAEASWWGPMDYSAAQALGGSVTGRLGTCMVEKDNTLYGMYYGDINADAEQSLALLSFNKGNGGRDVPYTEVVSGLTWKPYNAGTNPLYAVGDVVMPSPLVRNGRLYVCTVGGQPGVGEPPWVDAAGVDVVDNAVTWREITGGSLKVRVPNNTVVPFAMEPAFKELDLGAKMNDKVFKRGDISAYFNVRQLAWLDLVVNGGNLLQYAGPVTIGDFTLGRTPAQNDLGMMTLDASAVAQEFQARQFVPSISVGRTRLNGTFGRGVIRGRSIQPKFTEGKGFIIDDSNDYIVFASYDAFVGLKTVQQVQVTHGYYQDMNDLMSHIITALNTGTAIEGMTTGVDPWSTDDAFAAGAPYMTTLKYTFSARAGSHMVVLVVKTDPGESITYNGTIMYVNRCARLLAMLGYDTGEAYTDAAMALGTAAPTLDGSRVNIIGEIASPVQVGVTKLCGVQVVPFYRSAAIIINDLQVDLVVKPGRPMPITARTS